MKPSVEREKSEVACHRGRGVKGLLGMGACCAVPLAAVLVLPYLGGSLAGVGTAALPFLALLACPLGMYFMMRFMRQPGPPPTPQGLPVDAQAEALNAEDVPPSAPLPPIVEQSQPLPLPPKGDEGFNGQKKQESQVEAASQETA